MIIFVVFIIAVTTFITIDTLSREKADLTVIVIANNGLETRTKELEEFFEKYTEDFDGNGYVHVDVIAAPQGPDTARYLGQDANNTKLMAYLQEGKAIFFVTDSNTDIEFMQLMTPALPLDFPDSKYVDEDGMSWNFGFLADELKYANMPNDIHLSMRIPAETFGDSKETMQKNYNKSLKVFKAMLEDLEKKAEETNVLYMLRIALSIIRPAIINLLLSWIFASITATRRCCSGPSRRYRRGCPGPCSSCSPPSGTRPIPRYLRARPSALAESRP